MTLDQNRPEGRRLVHFAEAVCDKEGGPGGWAVVSCFMDGNRPVGRSDFYKGVPYVTTSERLELEAMTEALWASPRGAEPIEIHTASDLIAFTMEVPDIKMMSLNDVPFANRDLWLHLVTIAAEHNVKWRLLRLNEVNEHIIRARKLAEFAASDAAETFRQRGDGT